MGDTLERGDVSKDPDLASTSRIDVWRRLVIDVRSLFTVTDITASLRGSASKVESNHEVVGLGQDSVIGCDVFHTILSVLSPSRRI